MTPLTKVDKFSPEINKVYFTNQYTLFHILEGSGSIEVDFNNYFDWQDKLIFLEKGQYIKFISDNFVVRRIEFPNEKLFRDKEVRVLFKHLVSLGYINFNDCEQCKTYLNNAIFSEQAGDIIDVSSKQWYWQNPFQANREEYQLIFDIKEIIDNEFSNHLSADDLAGIIGQKGYQAQALVKDKVGITVKGLLSKKQLIEGKKEVAFTDKSIQEIAYNLGYKDPSYFNRVFRKGTGQSPIQFRENYDYENRDRFTQNLLELLKDYHTEQRSLSFYADKMNLSVKALSKKVKDKLNMSLGQMIRFELVESSKASLLQGATVKEVAFSLGFEEPNHFSSFFKHHTGITPTDFLSKKYHS